MIRAINASINMEQEYWELEFKLARIADRYKVSRKYLQDHIEEFDYDVRAEVAEILWAQVDILECIEKQKRRSHLKLIVSN